MLPIFTIFSISFYDHSSGIILNVTTVCIFLKAPKMERAEFIKIFEFENNVDWIYTV